MKSYPSIDGIRKLLRQGEMHPIGSPCLAFYKYDGSNIRAEWSRKRGWYKFGTRKTMIDKNTPFWGQVIPLWHEQLADPIEQVIRTNKNYKGADSIIAFAEFFGEGSFAGQHTDGPKSLKLFDVNVHKKGLVSPHRFTEDFDHNIRSQVLYSGPLTVEFVKTIQQTDNLAVLDEGVVVKGGEGHGLWMAKIKTESWIRRVKANYPDSWQKFHDEDDAADV